MANMSKEKTKMPEQDPEARNKNFSEVALGYEYEMAKTEAARCIQCKNKPCIEGCPVLVDIPAFIKLITEDKLDESYALLKDTNSLPAICGRVCPQETQCEQFCVRGKKGEPVAIGRLERYVADRAIALMEERDGNGKGAAPLEGEAGESCAPRDGAAKASAENAITDKAAVANADAGAAADANKAAAADVAADKATAADACADKAAAANAGADKAAIASDVCAAANAKADKAVAAADACAAANAGADKAAATADACAVANADADKAAAANAGAGKKVAIIGSGPASLTCAGDLVKLGYDITIFEAFHVTGGVLMYGIPEFRLPKKLVQQEIDQLRDLGVKFELNAIVGKTVDIDDLRKEGFEAFFIGTGAGLPSFMKIPGENLCGVYSSNEFLTRINLMKAYKFPEADTPVKRGNKVAVFGGGNVAMDAARCAKRLGAENVYIVYRRSEKEMPARVEEVHHAAEEGIIFEMLTNPTRILDNGEGWVAGVECLRMELGEPDASGRRRPIPIKGSEFTIEVDTVVVAIGNSPNPIVKNSTPGLNAHSWGGLIVDEETGATNLEGIYAGGDAVTGAATVILAMGAGKTAAAAMDKYLRSLSTDLK